MTRCSQLSSLFAIACCVAVGAMLWATAQAQYAPRTLLPGRVLPAVANVAGAEYLAKPLMAEAAPITITVVLRRRDAAGFQRLLAEHYDPSKKCKPHKIDAARAGETG